MEKMGEKIKVDVLLSISPTTIMIRALVLFTAMPVHECAHGWMADKLGDRTARSSGRLTLNPFAHLDLFGSILLFAGRSRLGKTGTGQSLLF